MSSKMTRRDFLKTTGAIAVGTQLISIDSAFAKKKEPAKYSTKLPQRVLGRTGVSVSILGLGGVGMLQEGKDVDACVQMVNEALDLGITYIDTARGYKTSEERIGQVMAKRRKEVFLATKVEDRTYDGAMKQFETSLKLLQTDMIDLIQVHHISPNEDVSALGAPKGVYRALQKLRDQKLVRFIGVTGHPQYAPVKTVLATYDWDCFLGFVNPLDDNKAFFEDQLPVARRKNMGVIAMKAYGGGWPAALIGTEPGKSPAPVLLRFALSMPLDSPIHVCVPGVSNIEQLRQNVEIVKSFKPMTEKECNALIARCNVKPDKKG